MKNNNNLNWALQLVLLKTTIEQKAKSYPERLCDGKLNENKALEQKFKEECKCIS